MATKRTLAPTAPPAERLVQGAPRSRAHPGRVAYRLAWLAALLSFFPYASWPVSTSFGLQACTVAGVGCLLFRPRTVGVARCAAAAALVIAPYVLSLTVGTWFDLFGSPDIAVKAVLTLAVSVATVFVMPVLAVKERGLSALVVVVLIAVVVHCSAAVVQFIAFRQDVFPFGPVFRLNPGFASFEEIGADYAHYVSRVFGLFPEPSAMSAALGPWLVLLVVALRWPSTTVDAPILRSHSGRILVWSAVAGGSVLIAASRSAYLVPYFGLLAVAMLSAPASEGRQAVVRRAVSAVALTVLGVYFLSELSNRGPSMGNASWTTRLQSLWFGVEAWLDSGTSALIGVGPGQSASLLTESFQGQLSAATEGAAIYSFLLRYISESGAVGLVAIGVVVWLAVRAMRRTAAPRLAYLVLAAWLISFGTATSYEGLLSLWLMLGALVLWDHLFARPAGDGANGATGSISWRQGAARKGTVSSSR